MPKMPKMPKMPTVHCSSVHNNICFGPFSIWQNTPTHTHTHERQNPNERLYDTNLSQYQSVNCEYLCIFAAKSKIDYQNWNKYILANGKL